MKKHKNRVGLFVFSIFFIGAFIAGIINHCVFMAGSKTPIPNFIYPATGIGRTIYLNAEQDHWYFITFVLHVVFWVLCFVSGFYYKLFKFPPADWSRPVKLFGFFQKKK